MSDPRQNYYQNMNYPGYNPNYNALPNQQPGQYNYCNQQPMPFYQGMPQQGYNMTSFPPQNLPFQGSCSPYPQMGLNPAGYGYPQTQTQFVGNNSQNQGGKYYFGPPIPSLKPQIGSNLNVDADKLKEALEGFDCNESLIIQILTHRISNDRGEIHKIYNKKESIKLCQRIEFKLKDPIQFFVLSLVYSGPDLDSFFLRKALKAFHVDESAIIEILSTRSHQQLEMIKSSYKNLYGDNLERDISFKTSGSLNKILEALLKSPRNTDMNINNEKAHQDAKSIHKGDMIFGSAPDNLIQIFTSTSYPQLKATFDAFSSLYQKSVPKYLKNYNKCGYLKTLLTIYSHSTKPTHFYSKLLKESIVEKKIEGVIRITLSRCEFDLGSIIQDYISSNRTDPLSDIKTNFPNLEGSNLFSGISALMGN